MAIPARETCSKEICSREARGSPLAPYFAGDLDHAPKLRLLRCERNRIAFLGAGKSALRAHRQPIELDVTARLLDPPHERGLVLERRRLGRDKTENDRLALWHEAQRREV